MAGLPAGLGPPAEVGLNTLDDELMLLVLTAAGNSLGSLELSRLEQTNKAFRRQLIEEASRVLVAGRFPKERGKRWLHALFELDRHVRPLVFSRCSDDVDIDGTVAVRAEISSMVGTAVASKSPMSRGTHKAEFTILQAGDGQGEGDELTVGIQRSVEGDPAEWASRLQQGSTEGWSWSKDATLWHTANQQGHATIPDWRQGYDEGDVVGLKLDFSRGTLVAYLNGGRLGFMATGLTGSFCWAVDLQQPGDQVSIARGAPPTHLLCTRENNRLANYATHITYVSVHDFGCRGGVGVGV